MGMENGYEYGNEDEHLEKAYRRKHNDIDDDDDELLEGTSSGSSSSLSSPLTSPSASSSSSSSCPPFCYDDSLEPQSHIPGSLSYPDVSSSPHKWSMTSASPGNSTRLSILSQSESSGQPAGYDPNRIPISVFGSRSSTPMEWSVASTESLFSIHVGNNSFSRDHTMSMNRSGELSKSEDGTCEAKHCNDRKSFSSTLAPVMEGALDNEEKSEHASEAFQVQESNTGSPQQNPEDISKIAASKEVHSFAMKSNASDGRGTPPASNPHRLSDDSGTSSSSFAFPVLVNESGNASSLKSVPEKPESEQKPQAEESQSQAEAESSKEEAPAVGTGWFSYLFCLRRCC